MIYRIKTEKEFINDYKQHLEKNGVYDDITNWYIYMNWNKEGMKYLFGKIIKPPIDFIQEETNYFKIDDWVIEKHMIVICEPSYKPRKLIFQ